jgi:mannose/cellobiose epimerase-like protein (N-acyl-D-glucosamine 2-epimerase family)
VASDGSVVDDRKSSYGFSFVIFALSHVLRLTGHESYRQSMERTIEEMERFREAGGGFSLYCDRSFENPEGRKQNPSMHYVEALLSVRTLLGREDVEGIAREWIDFLFADHRLVRLSYAGGAEARVIPEAYDEDWNPTEVGQKVAVSVGHLFEWGFLLTWAELFGLRTDGLVKPGELLSVAVSLGVDEKHGGAWVDLDFAGNRRLETKRYWEQAELIRALWYAEPSDPAIRGDHALGQALELFQGSFHDKELGGVFGAIGPSGEVTDSAKGNIWKCDYHAFGMCEALLGKGLFDLASLETRSP